MDMPELVLKWASVLSGTEMWTSGLHTFSNVAVRGWPPRGVVIAPGFVDHWNGAVWRIGLSYRTWYFRIPCAEARGALRPLELIASVD